ncbi:hypothetical protein CR513_35059, partial [Mucuna pruriens]
MKKKKWLKELLDFLKVYEIEMNEDEGQRKGKCITLKAHEASKGSSPKAFKAKESCEATSKEEGPDEDKLCFISRKIYSMWKNKGGSKWKNNSRRYTNEVEDKSQVVCYECKKHRHFKSKCPSLEKDKEKKKGLMETWENLDLSSFEEDDEIWLTTRKRHQSWCLDSGYSHYMMVERSIFQDFMSKSGGWVIFGGNQNSKIARVDKIDKHPFPSIDNMLFVEGLRHNLLIISQLSDNEYDVSFNKGECIVKYLDGSLLFFARRQNNLYKINLTELTNQNVTCLVSINNDKWTWHKKLGHASLRLISKLKKHNLVRGLPRLVYKTPYKLWNGKQPNISYFHPFGCECFVLNTKDNVRKFDPNLDQGTFLGYSDAPKAYRVYNSRTLTIEEPIHRITSHNSKIYLKSTTNLRLWFKKSDNYRLKGYCGAHYAGDRIKRKSTSGGCHFIGANLVS